jgi:adenosylmethionine-8-amino-7-oxononanoate aminotransferase
MQRQKSSTLEREISAILTADLEHVWHPFTSAREYASSGPIIIVEGKGASVRDINGGEYLDAVSVLANVNVGHGRPEIARAVADQMRQLGFWSLFGYSHPRAIELAAKLVSLTGGRMNKVFFTNGGSESNETAIKIARQWAKQAGTRTKRKYKVVALRGGYHGVTLGALAATGVTHMREKFEPLPEGFRHVPAPYWYRCPCGAETYADCGARCAQYLEDLVKFEGPETVAAFIAEPVLAVAGVIVPSPEYFIAVREICDKYEILFIADEVVTGFGRLGRMFGLENWGVWPDLITTAKGISSGYIPIGAVLATEKVASAFDGEPGEALDFYHGNTSAGHPVACAAAMENINIIQREELCNRAREMGSYLTERLTRLYRFDQVGDVRGMGLLAAVEFVSDRKTKSRLMIGKDVYKESLRRGVIVRAQSDGNIISLSPPLVIDKGQIDLIVEVLGESIAAAASK